MPLVTACPLWLYVGSEDGRRSREVRVFSAYSREELPLSRERRWSREDREWAMSSIREGIARWRERVFEGQAVPMWSLIAGFGRAFGVSRSGEDTGSDCRT